MDVWQAITATVEQEKEQNHGQREKSGSQVGAVTQITAVGSEISLKNFNPTKYIPQGLLKTLNYVIASFLFEVLMNFQNYLHLNFSNSFHFLLSTMLHSLANLQLHQPLQSW